MRIPTSVLAFFACALMVVQPVMSAGNVGSTDEATPAVSSGPDGGGCGPSNPAIPSSEPIPSPDGPAVYRIYGTVFINWYNLTDEYLLEVYGSGVCYFAGVPEKTGWTHFDFPVPEDEPSTPVKDGFISSDPMYFRLVFLETPLWAYETLPFKPGETTHIDLHFSPDELRPQPGLVINELVWDYQGGQLDYAYVYSTTYIDYTRYALADDDGWMCPLSISKHTRTKEWGDQYMIFVDLTEEPTLQIEPRDEILLLWRDPTGIVGSGTWMAIDRWEWGNDDMVNPAPDNTIMKDLMGDYAPAWGIQRRVNGTDSDDCDADLFYVDPAFVTPPYDALPSDAYPPLSTISTFLPHDTNAEELYLDYWAQDEADPDTGLISGFGLVEAYWQRDGGPRVCYSSIDHANQGKDGEKIFGSFYTKPILDGYYCFCSLAVDASDNVEPFPGEGIYSDEEVNSVPGDAVSIWDAGTIIDRTDPTASVTGGVPAVVNSAGPHSLTLSFSDSSPSTVNVSGVSYVGLYAWTPLSGGWIFTGVSENAPDSDFTFDPYSFTDGEGWYRFATIAHDYANNMENAPTTLTDAEFSVRYNANSFSFPVHMGWNLVSLPCDTSGDPSAVFDDSGGDDSLAWTMAQWYDASSGEWRVYDSSAPPFINDLTSVANTMGVWLKVTAVGDGLLTVSGQRPSSTEISLKKGWNLVGYPSWAATVPASTAFSGLTYDSVQTYSSTGAYNLRTVPDAECLSPGSGYWIHVTAACVWTVTG